MNLHIIFVVCVTGPATVQFQNPTLTTQEGVPTLQVCVQLNLPAGTTLGCDLIVPLVGNSGQRASMSLCMCVCLLPANARCMPSSEAYFPIFMLKCMYV